MRRALRNRSRVPAVLLSTLLLLAGLPFLSVLPVLGLLAPRPVAASGPLSVPVTLKVSVSAAGGSANNHSYAPSVSGDGQWVAFESRASNLVAGDSNLRRDIFVRNTRAGATERVSVSSSEVQADQDSFQPSISRDGRYVAFVSRALKGAIENQVPSNLYQQIALRAAQSGQAGKVILEKLGDAPRLIANYGPGQWVKMQYVLRAESDGRVVAVVNWFRNLATGKDVEFKFKP